MESKNRNQENIQRFEENNAPETLLSWDSHARFYDHKGKKWGYITLILTLVTAIIFYSLGGLSLSILIIGFGFVYFLLSTVQPNAVHYQITRSGVITGERFFDWDDLEHYWIGDYQGKPVLYLKTRKIFPDQLVILLEGIAIDEVQRTMDVFLPFEQQNLKGYATVIDNLSQMASVTVPKRFKKSKLFNSIARRFSKKT